MIKPLAPTEWIACGTESQVNIVFGIYVQNVQTSQEFVWKRSTSANVSMYELTIKKDEERAVIYDVCDKDQVNDIYCRGEVAFVPPDFFFEEGTKYKINVYRLVHSHVMDQDFVLPTFLAVLWNTMVSA